ncbi:hypothetical protein A3G67_05015 [Candidatus Roizmanbacteria bacterium RIFCSPLOWO2_12_FULL_40_12]|uniref:Glycosyltransferase RgtA/B/C/D-like domain-containing protein n=1 Tax=Candidatus Roizmanbacteria bacterium RIFCSPLOWO2_01_FULL_40_42 TaxID=1802066 RepID=A0A1F7J4G5_9BACT|nr:MAG: hypothetical protein A2779_04135 [Candidatus Roizmanbacteria bacterium RIFCSPHIGHO2_01_FULL_40_98]OGK27267.1 MAG: hypothetical protein A3C31_04460 [Candidatus Roizmanbacteria bacterium RIFCSPHIGHO2_02_FULL_40_53]OGK30861.1 MAG: hypothetical protein A2W49_02580 [Candidatus Roizmanbacteria bacterium RIFCSPHIGHO2_12_41_18]OGK36372.1 MAG: hypothetical protein A3E69_02085 [Candidatus Roizmanbacteria bacterium RIFCSPHIGHO2_12_FULL_40_130]OGK50500.1 MAG: hypothetical protein A3B50_01815 [Candi
MLEFLFSKTPLLYFVQDFWRDEAFTAILSQKKLLDIIYLTARDFNPPLYYILVHFWIKLFGHSEIAIRSLSFLFFAGTALAVFLLMEQVFKFRPKKAYIYLLVFLFNPLLLYNAFEARMYSMLAFFATLSWYFLKTEKRKSYVVATTLGLYTHYFMVFVLASQIFYIVSSHFLKKKIKLLDYKEIGLVFIFFVPWLIFLISSHSFSKENFWILKPQFETYAHMPSLLYTGYEFGFRFFQNYLFPLTIFFNIVPLYGLYKLRQQSEKYRDIFVLLTSWAFIPVFITFGISLFNPLFLPRYLIASSVGLTLLIIYVIDEFPVLLKLLLIAFLIFYSSLYLQLHLQKRAKAPVKKAFYEIKLLSRGDEPLYVTDELDFFTAQYYFDQNRIYIFSKDYGEIPSYTGKVLIPKGKIVNRLPYYPKKAFVLKDDHSYTIEALY